MVSSKNYVQVPCYLSRKQKEILSDFQELILSQYDFQISYTEIIRDAVVEFLDKMEKDKLDNYMRNKGILKD